MLNWISEILGFFSKNFVTKCEASQKYKDFYCFGQNQRFEHDTILNQALANKRKILDNTLKLKPKNRENISNEISKKFSTNHYREILNKKCSKSSNNLSCPIIFLKMHPLG